MRAYVVDASAAVKWYIPESLSEQAVRLLDLSQESGAVLLAPDLILPEIVNVLWKKHSRSELSADESRTITQSIVEEFPARLVPSLALLPAAIEIALAYGRTVYDCLYVALAAAEGVPLVTADERLANAMRNTVYAGLIKYLGEMNEDTAQRPGCRLD